MVLHSELKFLVEYTVALNQSLEASGHKKLSRIQLGWLKFVLGGMLLTCSLCWSRLSRLSLCGYTDKALSKMFHHGLRCWEALLACSTNAVLKYYDVREGALVIDDTDRGRSKRTSKIYGVHKTLLKGTGGFHFAQNIVLVLLVTPRVTIPVGFRFYRPDPALKEWEKQDDELKAQGVPKRERPRAPARDENYPSREAIASRLIEDFADNHPSVKVSGVIADAGYCSPTFVITTRETYPDAQVLTQIRSNQKVKHGRGKETTVSKFFESRPWKTETICLRGHLPTVVNYCSAMLTVSSHGKKYLVVALRYDGADEPRFIIAADSSWRPKDILMYYSRRWLVEVFFEDWKQHEGWANLAYQQAYEGSRRGLILSLLLDHSLLFHELQSARLKHKLPALTVGSLRSAISSEALYSLVESIVQSENPTDQLHRLKQHLELSQIKTNSTKHIAGKNVPKLHPRSSSSPGPEASTLNDLKIAA